MQFSWKDIIKSAFRQLGGVASYEDLYEEIVRQNLRNFTPEWKATVRREIENHSADSDNFRHGEDIFYSVKGLGRGIWGIRDSLETLVPLAHDIEDQQSSVQRVETVTYRIVRDTLLAREVKALHHFKCQICGDTLRIGNRPYAEAHHIRPLGSPHNGNDKVENIMIVCPNHHVMLDFGAISLDAEHLNHNSAHKVSQDNVAYHNKFIFEVSNKL